jgi:hypothetical protein
LNQKEYKIKAEEEIETDLTESHRGYADFIAKKMVKH